MTLDPVQEEYTRLATQYDRRWAFYIKATLQETLNRITLNPHAQILDLGCGTGLLIEHILSLAPNVEILGLDASAEMLNIAKQRLPDSVTLQLGQGDQMPFPDESFSCVISTSVFHYFRNPEKVIQEMKRVLQPGGFLLVTDWCNDYWTCQILDVFLHLTNRAHFHTYTTQEFQNLLRNGGFKDVVIETYKINWFWGMMTATATKPIHTSLI